MTLEEQVIEFQKTGNTECGKEIFAKAYYWANCIISKSYSSFGFYDDLFSEAHDAIVEAIGKYKEGKTKFSTFCSTCIRNNISTFICKRKKGLAIQITPQEASDINFARKSLELKEALYSLSPKYRDCLLMGGDNKITRYKATQRLKELLSE